MSAQTPPPAPPAPPAPPVPVPASASPDAPTLPYGTAPLVPTATPGPAASGPAVAAYGAAAAGVGHGAPPAPWAPPATAPQNVLAWVAFGLGFGALLVGPVSSIAAIVCGHLARAQIRRTGEQGAAAALTGLIFGYVLTIGIVVAIVLYVLFIVALVAGAAYTSGVPTSL